MFYANSNMIKLEILEEFKPKLGKPDSKLELLKLEKLKKLELALCSNSKF